MCFPGLMWPRQVLDLASLCQDPEDPDGLEKLEAVTQVSGDSCQEEQEQIRYIYIYEFRCLCYGCEELYPFEEASGSVIQFKGVLLSCVMFNHGFHSFALYILNVLGITLRSPCVFGVTAIYLGTD